jgi:hypothetical protein
MEGCRGDDGSEVYVVVDSAALIDEWYHFVATLGTRLSYIGD